MGHLVVLESQGTVHKTYHVPSEKPDNFAPVLPDLTPLLKQIGDTHQGFVIDDTRKDPRWPGVMGESAHSMVIVPMFGRFNLLGLLALAHEQPKYFAQEHMLLLQAIASQAAIAMENSLLFSRIENMQRELASSISSGIAEPLANIKKTKSTHRAGWPAERKSKMYLKNILNDTISIDEQVNKLLTAAKRDLSTVIARPV
jgi:GAF domain-containing protein